MKLSVSEENYLKTVYHLQEADQKATTNQVAEALKTSPASVTDMMKKLHAKKLLHYKPYYGFSLSNEGRKIALSIIRRHRLWEFFLAEKLGFGWNEVHIVAEELEHVRHKKLIDKLDEFLGYPAFDPHGDPIPNSKGKMQYTIKTNLFDLPLHKPGTISHVSGQSKELLDELAQLQISIGSQIEVKKRSTFDKSLQVKLNNKNVLLTEQIARHLFVNRI